MSLNMNSHVFTRKELLWFGQCLYAHTRSWVKFSGPYQDLSEAVMHLPNADWCSLCPAWITRICVKFACTYKDLEYVVMHLPEFGSWRPTPTRIWVTLACIYQNECEWWRHAPTRLLVMVPCTYQGLGDAVMHLPGFGWRSHAPTRLWVMLPCSLMLVAMTKAASCCLSWYRPMICRQTESGDCRKKGTLQHSNQKHSLRASGIHFRFERKTNQPKSPRTIA